MEYLKKTIVLPVCGLEAEVREGDGDGDEILSMQEKPLLDGVPPYLAYSTLRIGDKTGITEDDILELKGRDREYLAVQVYMVNEGGPEISLRCACEECGEEAGVKTSVDDLDFMALPAELVGPDPEFSVKLPRSGITATYGLLTYREENDLIRRLLKGNIGAFDGILARIRSLGDTRKPDLKVRHVRELPRKDIGVLREEMRKRHCGYDPRVRWKCNHCNHVNVENLFAVQSFFFPGA